MGLREIHRAALAEAADLIREHRDGATGALHGILIKRYACVISDAGLAGTRANMLGVTATSTAGLHSALNNWAAAARRRLEAATPNRDT